MVVSPDPFGWCCCSHSLLLGGAALASEHSVFVLMIKQLYRLKLSKKKKKKHTHRKTRARVVAWTELVVLLVAVDVWELSHQELTRNGFVGSGASSSDMSSDSGGCDAKIRALRRSSGPSDGQL